MTKTVKIRKFYEGQVFCLIRGGFLIFQISWKKGQTQPTQLQERFHHDIQSQKMVKLPEKSAKKLVSLLFYGYISKLFTGFPKYKRNNKVWKRIKFAKGLYMTCDISIF